MTTAADELRTAAEKLRTLATAASTDRRGTPTLRWHFKERPGLGSGYLYAENPDGPGARIIHGGSSGPHGRGLHPGMSPQHGEYVAAMDPTVGLAVADWLESAAEDAEHIGPDPHAVVGPRAILGGRP